MHRSGGIRLHSQADQQRAPAVHAQVLAGAVTPIEGAALKLETARTELEDIEIRLLLEGIRLCYGYDFREYALAPIRRGLSAAMARADEGVLGRCSIYATDLNDDMLAVARLGSYPLDRIRRFDEAYLASGGRGSLSDHYSIAGRNAHFSRDLQKSVTWARHNLA